jgi:GNAT superfamily N-acetyltransferase
MSVPEILRPPAEPARPPTAGEVVVRDAVPADYETMREIFAAGYAEFAPFFPPGVFDAYREDWQAVEQRAGDADLIVAGVGEEALGTVALYPDAALEGLGWPAGWAGVRTLAVVPGARGLGVGRALMAECLRRAEAWGSPAVALHTTEFMQAARRLYCRLGFRRDPRFDRSVGSGGSAEERLALIGYVLPLPARA